MRSLLVVLALGAVTTEAFSQEACEAAGCPGGRNECTTLVLHARETDAASCNDAIEDDELDCEGVHPTVTLYEPGIYAITVLMNHYDDIAAAEAAFEWPEGWSLMEQVWGCQSRTLCAVTPSAPGARTGSFACAWDLAAEDRLTPLGVMVFDVSTPGCLTIVQSDYPGGTSLVDGDNRQHPIFEENWGRVCLQQPGLDACDCRTTCAAPHAEDGQACDDGNACTAEDVCRDAACDGRDPVACRAPDDCHAGVCDPGIGCTAVPLENGTACDDEDACTNADACLEGVCAGDARVCAPLGECHERGICDPAAGACTTVTSPDGTPCAEGECVDGVCVDAPSAEAGTQRVDGGCGCRASASGAGHEAIASLVVFVGAIRRGRMRLTTAA